MSGIEPMMFFAAAAATKAAGDIYQGDQQRRMYNTQADVALQRAQVERQQAAANEDAQRRKMDFQLGKMRAALAENGGFQGSNLDLYSQSAAQAELDALNIRYGGELAADSALSDASMLRSRAKTANTAGYLNAAADALSSYGGYTRGTAKLSG